MRPDNSQRFVVPLARKATLQTTHTFDRIRIQFNNRAVGRQQPRKHWASGRSDEKKGPLRSPAGASSLATVRVFLRDFQKGRCAVFAVAAPEGMADAVVDRRATGRDWPAVRPSREQASSHSWDRVQPVEIGRLSGRHREQARSHNWIGVRP